MKVTDSNRKRVVDDKGNSYLTLKDLHFNKYHTIEIWLSMTQMSLAWCFFCLIYSERYSGDKCEESTTERE